MKMLLILIQIRKILFTLGYETVSIIRSIMVSNYKHQSEAKSACVTVIKRDFGRCVAVVFQTDYSVGNKTPPNIFEL